jgi:AcrR family transcriptional regulator
MAARRSPEYARRLLLRAAATLFARDGFDAVNSNQIARAAGLGVGTFYRHFEDKQSIADALMLKVWEELGSAMPGPEIDRPASFARRATESVIEWAEEHPDRFRAAFAWARRSKVAPSMRPIERRFRQLSDGAADLQALDPTVAARAWWAMLSGTLVWWLEDPSRASRKQLIDTLTRLHPMAASDVDAG